MTDAPLLSIPDDPVPEGGRGFWYEGAHGVRLRAGMFPVEAPRGSVVLSPGRTESIEKYWEVVRRLRALGFTVVVHDWRGQGLSEPRQTDPLVGHVDRAADYAADYRLLLDAIAGQAPKPWISLSHSMGGMAVLLALSEGERRLAGAALSAPLLGLEEVSRRPRALPVIVGLMRLMGCAASPLPIRDFTPRLDNFEGNALTHDQARYERWARLTATHPGLSVGRPTFGWLGAAMAAFKALGRAADADLPPLLLFGAEEDRVVQTAPIKALVERLASARYVEIPGARHELMFETDAISAPFWRETESFLESLASPTP